MAFTISPNMTLIIPGVGNEQGPSYAFDVNASLTLIDQHDHSPGKGVQITPSGLNLNSTVDFKSNSAINLKLANFTAQGSASSLIQTLSVAPGSGTGQEDLFFTDGVGNQIQITKSGIVNATATSIPGESYAAGTFIWTQTQSSLPTTPANFDIGSITLRPNTAATTNGVTLDASGVSSAYSLVLPTIPAQKSFLTITTGGVIAGDVSTSGGITGSNIAAGTITGSNIANGTITANKLASGALQFNVAQFATPGAATWTVPSGVTSVICKVVGGGGGGGGGAGKFGSTNGGGGGGAGVSPIESVLIVTPGETLNLDIGFAGAGGAGGTTVASPGGGGTKGSLTRVSRGSERLIQSDGGDGGVGGNTSDAPGGSGDFSAARLANAGGTGHLGGISGGNGSIGFEGDGGSGGTGLNISGGGGGGGAGWGNGENGGNGVSGGANGTNGINGGGSIGHNGTGGGGGGGGSQFTGNGGNGGNGGVGRVDFYWLS